MTAPPIARTDTCSYWLALALSPQLGPARARKLAQHFGGAISTFHRPLTELEAAGLHAATAQAIFGGQALASAEEELVRAAAAGAQVHGDVDAGQASRLRPRERVAV